MATAAVSVHLVLVSASDDSGGVSAIGDRVGLL
jgi:hypothetical protein